jgi:membrane-bound inhibitor of C-type lysozyme
MGALTVARLSRYKSCVFRKSLPGFSFRQQSRGHHLLLALHTFQSRETGMSRLNSGVSAGAVLLMSLTPAFAEDKADVIYRCDDGRGVTASFVTAPNEVLLTTDGQILRLPQGLSGSGARYTDGTVLFWIKGNDAQLEMPGRSTSCHVQ